MPEEIERDVREEIRVALFWRALIGDYEYIKFNPEDMFRWYEGLELRGPDEIRDLIHERYNTRPVPAVLGIVMQAPHPPTWLVREWLAHHENQVHVRGTILKGAAVLTGLAFMIGPFVYGCSHLTTLNPYAMNPPTAQLQTVQPTLAQAQGASGPTQTPVAFTPTATGPRSEGIAGTTQGGSAPNGVTGPSATGIASSSISAGASTGSSQP